MEKRPSDLRLANTKRTSDLQLEHKGVKKSKPIVSIVPPAAPPLEPPVAPPFDRTFGGMLTNKYEEWRRHQKCAIGKQA